MNASPGHTSIQSRFRNADPPDLHLAAIAFAYPVAEGLLSFSEASGYLARAAIRQGVLHSDMPMAGFHRLLDRLDRTIGETCIVNEAKAAEAIRMWLRLCVERRLTCPITILENARGINDQHGGALPQRCVDYLVSIEVPHG